MPHPAVLATLTPSERAELETLQTEAHKLALQEKSLLSTGGRAASISEVALNLQTNRTNIYNTEKSAFAKIRRGHHGKELLTLLNRLSK